MKIGADTRVLVSGASRGIGLSLARALAGRGATVGLLSRSGEELEALARGMPGTHYALEADVGNAETVARAVAGFTARAGGLADLIAAAVGAHVGPDQGRARSFPNPRHPR